MEVVHRCKHPEIARSADTARVDGLRSTLDPYLDKQRRIVPAGRPSSRDGKRVNPFRTAVPVWEQASQIS